MLMLFNLVVFIFFIDSGECVGYVIMCLFVLVVFLMLMLDVLLKILSLFLILLCFFMLLVFVLVLICLLIIISFWFCYKNDKMYMFFILKKFMYFMWCWNCKIRVKNGDINMIVVNSFIEKSDFGNMNNFEDGGRCVLMKFIKR